jgi:hypothetical protein
VTLPRARGLAVGVALLGALAGCDVSHLQFRADDRLSFSAPRSRELVSAPFTVSWSMEDFDPVGLDGSSDKGRGAFAVFVDRAPMPLGKGLKWLARHDKGCERDPRCPDAEYLADRGVYLTTDTSLTVERLPAAGEGVGNEQHFVNVVLVDGQGQRIGESAWYRAFQTKRRSS